MKFYSLAEEDARNAEYIHIHIRLHPKRLYTFSVVVLLHAILLFLILQIKQHIQSTHEGKKPMVYLDSTKPEKASHTLPEKEKLFPNPPIPQPHRPRSVPLATNSDGITEKKLPINPEPLVDMSRMLETARERRKQAEIQAQAENEAAGKSARNLTPQEIAEANVKRSLEQAQNPGGTNGVFQITHKGVREGTFTFRGWKTHTNGWKQTINVDAGLNGNIDLAMVKKMIELIRSHYKGDFRWESQRLGKIITLSARLEDNEQLEKFLLEEFPEFSGKRY